MAEIETKKALSYEGLKIYDSEIKKKLNAGDTATLTSAKSYADSKAQELANGAVKKNTDAIAVLNGSGVGSVSKTVADAIAKIVAEAPESYDTLKEISDWITSHASSASDMNSKIQANKTDISNLKALVGTLPESTEATTIIEYIDSVVADVDFSAEIAEAKQQAISTAAEDATSKANKALNDAKAYTESYSATKAQGAKADTALQKSNITTGTENGSISVGGTDVKVKGLGSAAYAESSQFDIAGTATTKVSELANGQVATNKNDISGLKTKVEALEANGFVEITEEEILALFK